jgi:PPOX class probable F420-dependent enzyme
MNIKQFDKKKYLNIETFRKNGDGIKTPVWFVEENGKLYIGTPADSGKVKRIKKNRIVNIAPCKVGGELLGIWVKAEADIIEDANRKREIDKLMNKKYGLMKKLFELGGSINKENSVVVEIAIIN